MTFKGFIKQNKLFFAFTVFFLVWVGFLVVLSLTVTREVIFYDYLAKKDVSSEYSSEIPFLRYLIEPIAGIILYLTFRGYIFPVTVLMGYIVLRVIYLILKKKQKNKSQKFNVIIEMVRDFFEFTNKIVLVLLIGLLAYFGIGFLLVGELIKYGFVPVLEILFSLALILMVFKLVMIIYIFYHPHLNFNYSQKRMKKKKAPKALHITKREFTYFFGFILLMITPMVLLMSSQLPTQTVVTDLEDDEILLDFHAHTTVSDGWLSPEERVRWYIEQGIDVAVITDHEHNEGAKEAKDYVEKFDLDLKIIIGEEFTTSYGIHLNIYGINNDIVPIEFKEYEKVSDNFKAMTTEDMIKHVKKEGCYVIVNHYYAGEFDKNAVPHKLEELRDWGVDGFEIINGGDKQSEAIRDFCLDNDLICISGSDVHEIQELTSFMKLRLDDPDDLSVKNIFKNLKRNDHEAVLIDYTPDVVQFEGFLANYREIERFINYLFNLDRFQYLSWIVWSLGVYTLIGLFYNKIKKSEITILEAKIN